MLFLYWILKLFETDLQPREETLFIYLFGYSITPMIPFGNTVCMYLAIHVCSQLHESSHVLLYLATDNPDVVCCPLLNSDNRISHFWSGVWKGRWNVELLSVNTRSFGQSESGFSWAHFPHMMLFCTSGRVGCAIVKPPLLLSGPVWAAALSGWAAVMDASGETDLKVVNWKLRQCWDDVIDFHTLNA